MSHHGNNSCGAYPHTQCITKIFKRLRGCVNYIQYTLSKQWIIEITQLANKPKIYPNYKSRQIQSMYKSHILK